MQLLIDVLYRVVWFSTCCRQARPWGLSSEPANPEFAVCLGSALSGLGQVQHFWMTQTDGHLLACPEAEVHWGEEKNLGGVARIRTMEILWWNCQHQVAKFALRVAASTLWFHWEQILASSTVASFKRQLLDGSPGIRRKNGSVLLAAFVPCCLYLRLLWANFILAYLQYFLYQAYELMCSLSCMTRLIYIHV